MKWDELQGQKWEDMQSMDVSGGALPPIPVDDPSLYPGAIVQPPQEDKGSYLGQMVSNIPQSSYQFAEDITRPIMHPIETSEAIGNLVLGAAQKLIPGVQGQEVYADQVGEFVKQRYGSFEAFKETVKNDPVGALADISMMLTGGGAAAARIPGVAGKAGKATQAAGMAVEPISLIKGGVKTGISKLTKKTTPVELYESSAKFSTTFPKAKRKALAETALEHKIMPTSKGIDKLDSLINNLDTRITGLIDDATKSGKKIPINAIFRHLKESRQKLGGAKINAAEDLKQIDAVAKKFHAQLMKENKTHFTPAELQEFKTDVYKRVKFDIGQLKAEKGTQSAQKGMARAAKESIEGVAKVKSLNKELGRLLELKDPLQRSAARIENRNIVSIDAPIKIAAGTAAGGGAGGAGGLFLAALEHPKMKAKLAIKLKEIQDMGLANMIDQRFVPTLVKYGLLQAGRLPAAENE